MPRFATGRGINNYFSSLNEYTEAYYAQISKEKTSTNHLYCDPHWLNGWSIPKEN